MNEVKKCAKCGNEMKRKRDLVGHAVEVIRIRKNSDWLGDVIIPFECQNCGYIELYNEKNLETKHR